MPYEADDWVEPNTKPGTPAETLAQLSLWQHEDGRRGYTLSTPDGEISSGPIEELVPMLQLHELLPLDPPPAPVFVAPRPPVPPRVAATNRVGFWPGR